VKRSPINRATEGAREWARERKKRLPARSKKMAKLYEEQRIPFVKTFLAENRTCMMCKEKRATEVDEYINRSQGGQIVPGKKAEAQGQRFHALCHDCHSRKTFNPKWARENGWSR
tara:strand:+ start:1420 stop:1764 length:345 start_codon:yes stop_codon:yes gene_type:complete